MPSITDITAMRVVVARMMPNKVRKLRSLLPRSDATAPVTASQKDALACIPRCRRGLGTNCSVLCVDPLQYGVVHPESRWFPRNKPEMSAVVGQEHPDGGVPAHGFLFI